MKYCQGQSYFAHGGTYDQWEERGTSRGGS